MIYFINSVNYIIYNVYSPFLCMELGKYQILILLVDYDVHMFDKESIRNRHKHTVMKIPAA